MIQFYSPDIESDLRISPDESLHCVKVLRHQPGDVVTVVDGRGNRFECRLLDADRKGARVEILNRDVVPPTWQGRLTVAVAPTKNMDRIDWLVEKLVEVGVDRIVMLECRQSERRVVKSDRLERIAVSAMKQSLKARLPEITGMTRFSDFIRETADSTARRFIAYCDPAIPRRELADELRAGSDTVIAIGPEGDFSRDEIEAALEAGFIPTSLGLSRLRTETAALYAAMAFHVIGIGNNRASSPLTE